MRVIQLLLTPSILIIREIFLLDWLILGLAARRSSRFDVERFRLELL